MGISWSLLTRILGVKSAGASGISGGILKHQSAWQVSMPGWFVQSVAQSLQFGAHDPYCMINLVGTHVA